MIAAFLITFGGVFGITGVLFLAADIYVTFARSSCFGVAVK